MEIYRPLCGVQWIHQSYRHYLSFLWRGIGLSLAILLIIALSVYAQLITISLCCMPLGVFCTLYVLTDPALRTRPTHFTSGLLSLVRAPTAWLIGLILAFPLQALLSMLPAFLGDIVESFIDLIIDSPSHTWIRLQDNLGTIIGHLLLLSVLILSLLFISLSIAILAHEALGHQIDQEYTEKPSWLQALILIIPNLLPIAIAILYFFLVNALTLILASFLGLLGGRSPLILLIPLDLLCVFFPGLLLLNTRISLALLRPRAATKR